MPEKLEKIPRLKTDNRWSFETIVFNNQLQLDTINNPDLPMTNLRLWKVHLPQIKNILMEDPETVSGSSDPVAISFPVLYTRTLLFIHSRWSEVKWNCSVVSDSLRLDGLCPMRSLHPWDSPGKNTGVGCHFLLQGIFLTQGSNLGLLHCKQMLLRSEPPGNR